MRVFRLFISLLLSLAIVLPVGAQVTAPEVMSIEQVIELAKRDSEIIRATDKTLQSIEAEIKSRDLVLSPVLTSDLAMFNDHRETLAGSTSNRRNTSGLLDLSLTKPFSTGTRLTLNVGHDLLNSESFSEQRNVADWEIKISQALWRDSFGQGTKLRRKAEQSELKSRRFGVLVDRQQFLVNVENAFWDLALAIKEIEIRNQTIERSFALEKWVRRRIGNFAAETTDLLQVQGLLRQRQLDLTTAKNRLEVARNTLRQYLPEADPALWTIDVKMLGLDRNPNQLVVGETSGTPKRLDALEIEYRAAQAKAEAERVDDTLRPQLDAYASYGSNGIENQFSRSWSRASSTDHDAARVGLLLSIELDSGLKSQRRTAARLNAEAEAYRAQALQRQSNVGWREALRNIENLKTQAKEARELSDLQNRKAQAERRRYEQGRTTALQITTFEVDAAESDLRLYRVLADLRKAESVARLFAAEEGL